MPEIAIYARVSTNQQDAARLDHVTKCRLDGAIRLTVGGQAHHFPLAVGPPIPEVLRDVAGVSDARADREEEAVTVEGEPDETDLVQAVEDAGYTAHV